MIYAAEHSGCRRAHSTTTIFMVSVYSILQTSASRRIIDRLTGILHEAVAARTNSDELLFDSDSMSSANVQI